ARRVVRDDGVEAAVGRPPDADGDARRRPAAHRLVERLADDLIDARLRLLGERLRRPDVDVDLDPVRERDALGERAQRRAEALVAEDDRLEAEREVAERADRLPMAAERARGDPLRVVEPA